MNALFVKARLVLTFTAIVFTTYQASALDAEKHLLAKNDKTNPFKIPKPYKMKDGSVYTILSANSAKIATSDGIIYIKAPRTVLVNAKDSVLDIVRGIGKKLFGIVVDTGSGTCKPEGVHVTAGGGNSSGSSGGSGTTIIINTAVAVYNCGLK